MDTKSDEEIGLFIRDELTGRLRFNAKALEAMGVNPIDAKQRGYLLQESSEAAEPASTQPHRHGR